MRTVKKPLVFVGQKGVTPTLIKAVDDVLGTHELIKVKFIEFKEKDQKDEVSGRIEKKTGSDCKVREQNEIISAKSKRSR